MLPEGVGLVPLDCAVTVTVALALCAAASLGPPAYTSSNVAVVDGSRTKSTPPFGPVSSAATLTHFLPVAS